MKEYTLSKNNIVIKYVKWLTGWSHRDFTNMCPFTWLSIALIILAPIAVPFKIMHTVLSKIGDWRLAARDARIRQIDQQATLIASRIHQGEWTDQDMQLFWDMCKRIRRVYKSEKYACFEDYYDSLGKLHLKLYHKMCRFGFSTDDLISAAVDGKCDYIHDRNLDAFVANVVEKYYKPMPKRIDPGVLTSVAKNFVTAMGILLIGLLLVMIGFVLIDNWSRIDWVVVGYVLLTSVAIYAFIMYVIPQLYRKIKPLVRTIKLPRTKIGPRIRSVLDYIGGVLYGLVNKVIGIFKLIKQLYKNYCPGIKWVD